jgi:hypothetical protein
VVFADHRGAESDEYRPPLGVGVTHDRAAAPLIDVLHLIVERRGR